ncbi:MAG: DUF819 family protein [Alphaproteobacteria bacterium]|nr:DUF819 family protein [Alphaproteobacteria bacterium]
MSLIDADNLFLLGGIIFALAWFGNWADTNAIGRKTSGALWVIVGGLVLSNINIIPAKAPLYDFVGGTLVPLSIPLLLFNADLRKIFRDSGRVMLVFFFAALATCLGTIGGFFLIGDLGAIGPKVAGVYTGGWIGGSINFVAISQSVEMTPDEFSAALSANSPVSIMALMLLLALPGIRFIRAFVSGARTNNPNDKDIHDKGAADKDAPPAPQTAKPQATKNTNLAPDAPIHLLLTHISGCLALSFAICALSAWLATLWGYPKYTILIITIISVLVANIFPNILGRLQGNFQLGILIMYIFFAVIGASTQASVFIDKAPRLFFYSIIIIIIHVSFMLLIARLLKFSLVEMVIASGAAIVGPAATAAIAMSKGWRDYVTPAIMCGIFGYAVANFIGLGVTKFLQLWYG